MAISGHEEQPIRLAVTVIDISSAHVATQGILAALFHRERTGEGQHIDVALYDAALSLQVTPFSAYLRTGKQPPRTGNATLLGAPADLFATRDGFIVVNAYFPEQWLRCVRFSSGEICWKTAIRRQRFASASSERFIYHPFRDVRETHDGRVDADTLLLAISSLARSVRTRTSRARNKPGSTA